MASQSLYRKWRSQKFDELVGQEPIVRTLKNALSSGKPAHAYLFTGPRGTGKTSTARLLAKTINCANPKDGEPCNECRQCREITAGNSFNVIEIDAASNRGIDSIRDLREKVMMPPSTGKYKVYVLDEAHMLTPEAFNALLKTLEEPPDYAIFVLATTDVHKMLPTVLSRCQRFDFKRITTRQIVEHLHFVAEQEHIRLERAAAELIARAAAGGMRDALSLLDQAIAYAGEEISLAQVQAMLGVADPQAISRLIMHVAKLDSSAGLHLMHELSEAGADLRQVNAQVVEFWRALLLAKAGADVATILDLTEDETRDVMSAARYFALEELTECARAFAQNDLVQKNQGTPQLGLELAFLECVELHRRTQSVQASLPTSAGIVQTHVAPARPTSFRGTEGDASVQVPGTPQRSTPAPTEPSPTGMESPSAQPAISRETRPASSSVPSKKSVEEMAEPDWDDIPPPIEHHEDEAPPEPAPVHRKARAAKDPVHESNEPATPAAITGGVDQPSLTLQQVKSAWGNVRKRTNQKSGLAAATLVHCKIVDIEGTGEQAVVVIQPANQAHYKIISDHSKDIEWALTTEFNHSCRVRLLPPGKSFSADPPSPLLETGSQLANAAPSGAPQQSAHSKRRASTSLAQSMQVEQEVPSQRLQEEELSYTGGPASIRGKNVSERKEEESADLPLARMSNVRENTSVGAPQDTLEQRARRDPIVQEVMKTFTARIVDIRPK